MNVALRSMASVGDLGPKAFSYLKVPRRIKLVKWSDFGSVLEYLWHHRRVRLHRGYHGHRQLAGLALQRKPSSSEGSISVEEGRRSIRRCLVRRRKDLYIYHILRV
jgi:hypothetical protein